MNTNIKFKRWLLHEKQTEHGDFLVKVEFADDTGKRYEWFPRLDDLHHIDHMVGAIQTTDNINKFNRKK